MIKSEIKEFTALIMAIAEVYGKKISNEAVLLYFDTLKDLSFQEIKAGMKMHCEDPIDGKFWPLPAHIRGKVCRPEKTSVIVWSEVENALCKHNYYDTVKFEDGTINAVIRDMGGWMWLSSHMDADEPWTQKEFERRYMSYKAQKIVLDEPLIGFIEQENRTKGYLENVPDTKLIGDGGNVVGYLEIPERRQLAAGGESDDMQQIVNKIADNMDMKKPLKLVE